jgi:hypothetical protein
MTRIHDIYYSTLDSFVDNGDGNGVWTYTFFDTIPDISSTTQYTRQAGELSFVISGNPPASGSLKSNGVVVIPDISATLDYYSYRYNWLTTLVGNPTIEIEIVGAGVTGGWDGASWASLRYRSYYTQIYPIVWLNPLTGNYVTSVEGSHLYDSTSDVTCPGYDFTVVNNYQIWGLGSETITRFRQRDDGLGNYDGTPPRTDIKSGSQQASERLPGNNTYR